MDGDGTNLRQVTSLGGASFAPYFTPDGKRIIFASNHEDPKGRDFELYLVNVDGTGLERVTSTRPSTASRCSRPTARTLVFAATARSAEGDTNVFIADWTP